MYMNVFEFSYIYSCVYISDPSQLRRVYRAALPQYLRTYEIMRTCMHTCIYVNTYVYGYMYVCIYIYVYIAEIHKFI